MKCDCCGNEFKIYDKYCGKCGVERKKIEYGPLNEDEKKFGIHSERYGAGYSSDYSVVLGKTSNISTMFTSLGDDIYGKYRDALVKINKNGECIWYRFEKAERLSEYPSAIFATSVGIFVKTQDDDFSLYDFDGSWMYDFNMKQIGAVLIDAYIYGDTVYGLYKYNSLDGENENFQIIAYCYGMDSQDVIWDFKEKAELLEYVGLCEIQKRLIGRGNGDGEVPEVATRDTFDMVYFCPGKFAVNSRRIVLEMQLECESEYTCSYRTLLLSIDIATGESSLILDYERNETDDVFYDRRIAFLDMSSEYIWFEKDCGGLHFDGFSLDENFMEMTEFNPSKVYESDFPSYIGRYFDGDFCIGVRDYNIAVADAGGSVAEWESHGYGDATCVNVLGDIIYERHGAFADSSASDWNFYKKQCEMEKVISVTESSLEEKYELLLNPVASVSVEKVEAVEVEKVEKAETAEPKKIARFCINCGEATVPGAKFCAFCGTKIMD